ncbi:M13 family metallopeptidase [Clostridium sp. HBUAS56010]|uniref:M13 family metallopeptidase n=1 Tax=Clostridium sp. HBUAS56010 TaxID=2571127 RepID=UPI001177A209|nr:M13 family metallopeptidase [Clostridium sp. HBUAS56010]
MKRKTRLCLMLVFVLSFVLSGCKGKSEPEPEQTAAKPVNVEGKAEHSTQQSENEVKLQDDYYDYVNGKLLREKEIPKDSNNWSYFYELDKEAYEVLNKTLKEAVDNRDQEQPGTLKQKIADLYLTALDMEGREKAGFGKLQPYINQIRGAKDLEEYLEAAGVIYSDLGVGSILLPQWSEDMKDSSRYALYMNGADLGPGKETLEDSSQAELMKKYEAYIGKIMEYSGMTREEGEKAAKDIFALQKDLAKSALPLSKRNDPGFIYNPYTEKELDQLLPGNTMDQFLKSAGLSGAGTYVVSQEEQLKAIGTYLTEESLELLKNYSVFCLIHDFGSYLTPEIRDSYVDWHNLQNGIKEKKTNEKLAGEMTQDILGFEFGKLYVEQQFSETDKNAMKDMVQQIIRGYKIQIDNLDWMGEETKTAALKKLDNMTLKIGYPDQWPDDYKKASVLSAKEDGNLIDNILSLVKAKNEVQKEKVKKPVDKGEWAMTPQTVNAYYNPTGNEIVFPAAILQPPFYDRDADFSSNLGGIGMIIAHEISHAFDSSGSLFDENGNYHVWWTKEDRARFEKLADEVAAYYDRQEGVEGRMVNGKQTLDENIADLGSMACITAITGDDENALRLLFRQYATIWASKYTREAMIKRLNTDVHSPAKVRVNAVLGATDAFYQAYPEIKEQDKMFVPPEQRVKIW